MTVPTILPSLSDLWWLLPELVLAGVACSILLLDLLVKPERRTILAHYALVGLAAAFVASYRLWEFDAKVFNDMVWVDAFSLFFNFVFLIGSALAILVSVRYLTIEGTHRGEYYALILFATVGMMIMASAGDLIMVYLGLELMSITLYILAGFFRREVRSNEAALKYFILGTLASGVLLYGISVLYGLTGTTALGGLGTALADPEISQPALVLGMVLIASAFSFKVAVAPFHMWTPDVYEGSPTAVTAFMSVGPKAAGFAVFLRVFAEVFPMLRPDWTVLLTVLAILTMAVGNVVAIAQSNVKRLLAYSSIAHAGYALIGLVAGTSMGYASVLFYLLLYTFMNMGAFGVVILLRHGGQKGEDLEDFRGLSKTHPLAAFLMLAFLFSLTGIPPLAGFFGKFYVFMAAVEAGMAWLAVVGILFSVVSAFFYLRIVMLMYMEEPKQSLDLATSPQLGIALAVSVLVTLGAVLILDPLFRLATAAVVPLF